MKTVVLILFAAIIFSLGSGLHYLSKEGQDSKRMLTALKFRVGLSLVLVLFLIGAFYFGYIQ